MTGERFHPLFVDDLRKAIDYYDSISVELGDRFRARVKELLQSIADRPDSFGRIGGDYRGALVRRFPYVIVFTIDTARLTFFGIRHAASDQGDWFSRSLSD